MKKQNKKEKFKTVKTVGTVLSIIKILFSLVMIALGAIVFGSMGYAVYKSFSVLKSILGM